MTTRSRLARIQSGDLVRPDSTPCGLASTYSNWRCRCEPCRSAWAAEIGRLKANRVARLRLDPSLAPHGRSSTYGNWGCRCPECTAAWTDMQRKKRRRVTA